MIKAHNSKQHQQGSVMKIAILISAPYKYYYYYYYYYYYSVVVIEAVNIYDLNESKFMGSCSPTPSLSQHFAQGDNLVSISI